MTFASESTSVMNDSFLQGVCVWEVDNTSSTCVLHSRLLADNASVERDVDCAVPDLVLKTIQSGLPQFEKSRPAASLGGVGPSKCCGFSVPIFTDGAVSSVIVLLGGLDDVCGVIESWQPIGQYAELHMAVGCYVGLERFENVSRFVRFEYGQGLPGQVWQSSSPLSQTNLSNNAGFMRAAGASAAELQSAVGFPVIGDDFIASVLLISSTRSPITRAVEVFSVDGSSNLIQRTSTESWLKDADADDCEAAFSFADAVANGNLPMLSTDLSEFAAGREERFQRRGIRFALGIPIGQLESSQVLVIYA